MRPPDAADSSLTSDTGRVSDGLDYVTVVATVNDRDGAPIPGASVSFSSSISSDAFSVAGRRTPLALTDASGQAIVRVKAVVSGTHTFTASIAGTDFSLSTLATFLDERSLPAFVDTGARLPTARSGLASALGNDGRIYALGGLLANGSVTNLVEALDPATLLWTTAPSMPTARSQLAAVSGTDGLITPSAGAAGLPSPAILPVLESFDARAGAWSELLPMTVSRAGLAAASNRVDQALVALGGGPTPTSSEVYTLASQSAWTSPTALPTGRAFLAAAFGSDANIYALGGDVAGGNGVPTDKVELFNPASGTWAPAPSMLTARELLAAVAAPDGRIYAIGGTSCPISTCSDTGAVEAYNPSLGLWSPVGSLQVPRSGLSAVVAPSGNLIVLGGSVGSDPTQAQMVEISRSAALRSGRLRRIRTRHRYADRQQLRP